MPWIPTQNQALHVFSPQYRHPLLIRDPLSYSGIAQRQGLGAGPYRWWRSVPDPTASSNQASCTLTRNPTRRDGAKRTANRDAMIRNNKMRVHGTAVICFLINALKKRRQDKKLQVGQRHWCDVPEQKSVRPQDHVFLTHTNNATSEATQLEVRRRTDKGDDKENDKTEETTSWLTTPVWRS